jgi:hypothetical protein
MIFGVCVCDVNVPDETFDNCLGAGVCNVINSCSFSVGDGSKDVNNDIEIKSSSLSFFQFQLNGSFTLSIQNTKSCKFTNLEVFYFRYFCLDFV